MPVGGREQEEACTRKCNAAQLMHFVSWKWDREEWPERGKGGGKERGYVMCVYVVCFWQINEPCEGECSALWSCHMHRASRGVASEG